MVEERGLRLEGAGTGRWLSTGRVERVSKRSCVPSLYMELPLSSPTPRTTREKPTLTPMKEQEEPYTFHADAEAQFSPSDVISHLAMRSVKHPRERRAPHNRRGGEQKGAQQEAAQLNAKCGQDGARQGRATSDLGWEDGEWCVWPVARAAQPRGRRGGVDGVCGSISTTLIC